MNEQFADVKTNEGMIISSDSETLAVGTEVYMMDEAGAKQPVPDGTYVLESGESIVVVESKITEILPMEEPESEDEPAMEPTQMSACNHNHSVELTGEHFAVILSNLQPTLDALTERIEKLESANASLLNDLTEEKNKNSELTTKMENFSKILGSDSKTVKNDIIVKQNEKFETLVERVREFKKSNSGK